MLLLVAAAVIGFLVRGDRTPLGDVDVLEWTQLIQFPGLDAIVRAINAGGGSLGGVIMALLLMSVGIAVHRPNFTAQVLIVLVLRLCGEILKPIFQSPRPAIEYIRHPELLLTTPGYPSGHTFTYTCIGGLLIVLAFTLDLRNPWRLTIMILGMLLPLLGGFARIWTGVHWPYDVVGGFLFGCAAIMIALTIVPISRAPVPERSRSTA